MANKVIEMKVTKGNSVVVFREVVSDAATWMAQAYIFHKFLLAQGYHLDSEQVGADVSDYIDSTDYAESEEW